MMLNFVVVLAIIATMVMARPLERPLGPLRSHKLDKRQRVCPLNPLSPGTERISTTHDGLRREYVVFVPSSYNNTLPLPLVFDVHGYTNTAEGQARESGMRDIAEANHFIVVNPEGTGALQSWNGGDCCVGNNEDDVGFFLRMIEEVATEHACIDLTRVYSGGWSNGGFMSHYLACETDAFAAIGPVAGTISLPCRAPEPVALWHIHGTNDLTIPYEGNFAWEGAEASQDGWAEINGCNAQTQIVYEERQTTCVSRYNCAGNATSSTESVLCTVEGGTHAYDFTLLGINSAQASWEFYSRFARI